VCIQWYIQKNFVSFFGLHSDQSTVFETCIRFSVGIGFPTVDMLIDIFMDSLADPLVLTLLSSGRSRGGVRHGPSYLVGGKMV
jgi:hypothetical protein